MRVLPATARSAAGGTGIAGAQRASVGLLSLCALSPPTLPPDGLARYDGSPGAELRDRWVVFSDLHVRQQSLPTCLAVLRTVKAEAAARDAGVICLGDFWHAGALLSTRQLNAVLAELSSWCADGAGPPVLMIPGNHDQAMRGNPAPELHALTPLARALPDTLRVFSRPTLVGDSLWLPYGVPEPAVRAACDAAATACADRPNGLAAVFCHADVVGGLMNENRAAERGVPADAFPPPPTRVYSGHYHKPHVVSEPAARGRRITYVGTPYQTSMAEAGQEKALLVLDRRDGWAVSESIPLDIGARHHVLRDPASEEVRELGQRLRRGDRVLVLTRDEPDLGADPGSDPESDAGSDLGAAVRAWRGAGAAVEVRPLGGFGPKTAESADEFADGTPELR